MGGTEAFPDLGEHCQESSCNQLDFLPFRCDGCQKVFCLEHRSYKSHECTKANPNDRTVVVCEICSVSVERQGNEKDEIILERHAKSGDCDPSKKKKPVCPVKRCKQVLTFSNSITCKDCHIKVCLRHRFPSDHGCNKHVASGSGSKFLIALAARSGKHCGTEKRLLPSPSRPTKAF
ncbi:zinc finger AN1 domain-containing stress-associated protein 12 [Aristolochia californica]|uniref:zinc finger AN1 domain-containing stress-associated protein 12 n=1 Tax=Aristolochia californica TaxID=171875 RepID=UPI0035DD0486